jgi:hypothetical protein
MTHRKISLDTISQLQFAHEEVLNEAEDRSERDHALRTAMALSNSDHEEIGLIVKLATGEIVEVVSTMIDYESDLVEVKGGYAIPLRAIMRVEL